MRKPTGMISLMFPFGNRSVLTEFIIDYTHQALDALGLDLHCQVVRVEHGFFIGEIVFGANVVVQFWPPACVFWPFFGHSKALKSSGEVVAKSVTFDCITLSYCVILTTKTGLGRMQICSTILCSQGELRMACHP